MKSYHGIVLALLASAMTAGGGRDASAQINVVNAKSRLAQRMAQQTPQAQPAPRTIQPPAQTAPRTQVEELPPGRGPAGRPVPPAPVFSDDAPPEYMHGGMPYDSGPCMNGCCEPYQCDSCSSGNGWGGFGYMGSGTSRSRFFFTADYLAVRTHFSESVAYVERVITTTPEQESRDIFHEFDFDTEHSFRLGGGWRLSDCGEEIRFQYTRLEGDADDSTANVAAPNLFLVPFLPAAVDPFAQNPLLRGQATMRANVEVDAFDLEFRKTMILGSKGAGCGDCCGCGDSCCCGCPTWDVTWSGGVRAAEVKWNRFYNYLANDPGPLTSATNNFSRETVSSLEFEGVGPRVGFEGRRYFGCRGWFSTFAKADLSLLWGDMEHEVRQRTIIDPTDATEDVFASQRVRTRQIIPVTELEAGISAHVTHCAMVSAGYLISAWHDLGFRDEFVGGSALSLETRYDDANILSFDGFFARVELSY